jgi:hypothetical protein
VHVCVYYVFGLSLRDRGGFVRIYLGIFLGRELGYFNIILFVRFWHYANIRWIVGFVLLLILAVSFFTICSVIVDTADEDITFSLV